MSDDEDYTDDDLYDEDESDLDEIIDKQKKRVGFLSKSTYKEIRDFVRFSLKTIFIFWVVFPFYSYQLQMFYDQKICNEESKDPSKNSCQIPYVSYKSPYGDGTKPPERPKSKKGWLARHRRDVGSRLTDIIELEKKAMSQSLTTSLYCWLRQNSACQGTQPNIQP